ncbi:MAG: 50S ribosome-binding GTPase [Proteobacteria bacterium]|nr:50S ribosome-binding GTPase [Pseudomonadota bacterium]
MKFNSKSILTFIIVAILLVSLFIVLMLTEKLLSIWHYLQDAPLWVSILYGTVIMLVALFGVYLYFLLLKPKPVVEKIKPLDESSLRASIAHHAQRGVDIDQARLELAELDKRRSQEMFYIALYGTVSAGKSSFIQALLPAQQIKTDVLSGTTKTIAVFKYKNLAIIDLPGLDDVYDDVRNDIHEADTNIEQLALDETLRAHVVVFLTDSDFTQTEMQVLTKLKQTKKPLVIALNKSDRYAATEQVQIIAALKHKTDKQYPVALIATGGLETIIYQDAQGKQHKKVQARPANIQPLLDAIEKVVANNPVILNRFRDAAILMLAQQKLNQAQIEFNRQQAELIISSYTKKAVFGAMAAVAPGSDIVIQGTLATKMVQNICALYEISPKTMEIDQVIRMTGGKLKTSVSLILAVAGNALKAFPGIGTAAGGVTHAVAYGMIFNALGYAVLESISTLGVLDAQATQQTFEENLLGPTKELAKDLAKMALKID